MAAGPRPGKGATFAHKHHVPRRGPLYEALVATPRLTPSTSRCPTGCTATGPWPRWPRGKHVLCEKPFTANADEARDGRPRGGRTGLVVMEAFHYRYHPLAARLVEIVGSGELGPIERIEISFSAPLAKRGDIRYRLDLAGGATHGHGLLPLSPAATLVGRGPRVVSARAKLSSPGVDRAMVPDFSLPGGAPPASAARCSPRRSCAMHATVTGSDGQLRVFNPFAPQFGHRLPCRSASGTRASTSPAGHLRLPARGLRATRSRTGARCRRRRSDAIATMELIDSHLPGRRALPPRHPPDMDAVDADAAGPRRPCRPRCSTRRIAAARGGAWGPHAELRIERIRSQMVRLRDGRARDGGPTTTSSAWACGCVVDGAIGFAATVDVDPGGGGRPGRPGRGDGPGHRDGRRRPVELADEPAHGEVTWSRATRIDPVTVPLADKVALLEGWSRRCSMPRSVAPRAAPRCSP